MKPAEYAIMRGVEDSHWWYRSLHSLVEESISRYLPVSQRAVLDAGCGTGAMLSRLADRGAVVGLDFSPIALGFTRARGHSKLVRGSVSTLPFADGSFAGVISLDVISHRSVPVPQSAIAEMARVTAPGGCIVLNVPAYEWLRSPHDEQIQNARRFSRRELVGQLQAANLEIVRVTHWNTLLMPGVVATRIVKRLTGSTQSDLPKRAPGIGAAICNGALAMERALVRHVPLPFGVSIFAVARKPLK